MSHVQILRVFNQTFHGDVFLLLTNTDCLSQFEDHVRNYVEGKYSPITFFE